MSEQKESSVLFSLKELMNLEEDRIRGEEEAKAAQVRAEEEARRAAERAAQDAQESRLRAEEERRRAEEQRQREEAARLEAIRQAEVEKARLEAEQQARMQAMAAQQQHERQLEVIRTDKGKKNLRNGLIGLVVAVLAIGTVVGVMVNKSNEEARSRQAFLEKQAADEKAAREQLETKLNEQSKNVKDIQAKLDAAKDETTKAKLQAELAAAKDAEESTKKALGKGPAAAGGGDKPPTPKAACTCKSTDPLCDCL